ncbi:MAG TPA: hypothetical protein VL099_09980 [Candidatus Binatia bacterium]|nr:hypothetical protein [Candidatus Binatia bacterium]
MRIPIRPTVLWAVCAACVALVWPLRRPAAASSDEPETVIATFRPQPGQEAALLEVIHQTRATLRRLDLVDESPYVLARATDPGGGVRYIELFTWKSAEIPDHAPPEVRTRWDRMQKLVQPRDGRPGIDFEAVSLLGEK